MMAKGVGMSPGEVEDARAGQTAEAVTSLQKFQEKYPKSVFGPDATETIALLKSANPPATWRTCS